MRFARSKLKPTGGSLALTITNTLPVFDVAICCLSMTQRYNRGSSRMPDSTFLASFQL